MFRDVPEFSGMFRNIPCSGFYRRPIEYRTIILNKFSSTSIRWFRNLRWHTHDTSANQKLLFSRLVRISSRAFPWQRSFILDNIISYSNLWPGTRFSLRATHSFCFKCFRRHMLLKICSKCEILLKCCPKGEKTSSLLVASSEGLKFDNVWSFSLPASSWRSTNSSS